MDNWRLAHQPIATSTLLGTDLVLLRRYHNRIKRALFSSVAPGATLLDIGSGRGGDLSKWTPYRHIIAVEPNSEHLQELRRRLDSLPDLAAKVTIIQIGGENYQEISRRVEEILGGPVDVVSLMLSLSFFWQDYQYLSNLARTITATLAPVGRILFLTIDGDAVEEQFAPLLDPHVITSEVKWGPIEIEYHPNQKRSPGAGRKLLIDLGDSIVQNQTEYLVHLNDLQTLLPTRNFTQFSANEERFLSDHEARLTRLYSYGTFEESRTGDSGVISVRRYQ